MLNKTEDNPTRFTLAEIADIARALITDDGLGTIEKAVERVVKDGRTYDDMTTRDCLHLDALAFCCEQCDYWHGEAEKARESDCGHGFICAGCES